MNEPRRRYRRELAQLLGAAWIARAAFMIVVPSSVRSVDAKSWDVVVQQLRAGVDPSWLNWPPLWMILLWVLDHTARGIGISLFLTVRLFLIAVESVVIVILYSFVSRVAPGEARRIVLIGVCLNPVSILLVCQHANFDVLVGLCSLAGALALASYGRSRDVIVWLAGSLVLGIGALAKTVPLVLAPLLARGAAASRPLARLIAAALFLGPIALGVAVIFVLAPHEVTKNVILYRSSPGYYGITGIADALGAPSVTSAYSKVVFPVLLVLGLVLACFKLWRQDLDERRILLVTAMLLLAVPTLGSGYAPQYAYWWLPPLVATYALFDSTWRRLLIGLYIIAAYTYIVEYAFNPFLGGFIDPFFPGSRFLLKAQHEFTILSTVTEIRLPLFLASAAVLFAGARRLRDVKTA